MKTTLAALLLATSAAVAAAPGELDKLRPGDTVRGFRVTTLYLDEADKALGARFVHERTGHTLDYLQIESVPQAYTWINSMPTSNQGEPHTQEHLLLLKGKRGRTLSSRQTMSLSASSAFTQLRRTSYFFNTAAGDDVFFDLFAEQTRAMLHPDYEDEEIRREVRFFGVTQDADKSLRLEEQGTVYQEMVSSTANPFSRLFRASSHLLYGERHPYAFNAGGEPADIRTMTVEDIRRFQKSTHHLANMGTIVAFSPAKPVAGVLARFDKLLTEADPQYKPRRAESPDDLPRPSPAPAGAIRIYEYPQRNEQQPSPLMLAWPATRELDANEQLLADLFLSTLAGDATTNLYKLFIDSRTRKLDIGARSVQGFVQAYGGYPLFVLFRDVAPANFSDEKLAAVRALVMDEVKRIASLPDGSAELQEFNGRLASRVVERRRDLVKFTGTPAGFGFRGGTSQWMDHLQMLERSPGERKSLTLKPQLAFVQGLLKSDRNFWREYLAKWRVLDVAPYIAAARPSPTLVQREESERLARVAAETERIKREYGIADTQEALRRFKAESEAKAASIEEEARKVAAIPFVPRPPLLLDGEIRHETVKLANGVPLTAARFDNMTSATTGIFLRLDGVPRDELRYVSLLPNLLTQVGVIENGKPVSFETMSERMRNEILGLDASFSANPRTGRTELRMRGSGIGEAEARRALGWMTLAATAPDWRPENLPRIRDVVDQALGALRNTTQGAEEAWVQNPMHAYRQQQSAAYLAANSFLTRTHNALRLRWLLKDASAEDAPALESFFDALVQAGKPLPRAELKTLLGSGKAPGLEALSPAARAIATDALKDLDLALVEMPDGSLGADFAYLAMAMRDDLRTPAAEALAKLESLRKRVMRTGGARMFLASSGELRAKLAKDIDALAARLERAPHAAAPAGTTKLVDARLAQRVPGADPMHVGLHAPNKQGGVIITSVPSAHFSDYADREKQLDYLATRLHAGGGGHGIFLKTLAAGLAYSNGIRGGISGGQVGYYAERTPELPQTVRFVVNELKAAKPLPHLGEYAVAQAFQESRAAQTYESRAEGMADDLVDGNDPATVRRFRQSLLELRRDPKLVDKLFERKDRAYARLLPGYGMKSAEVRDGTFYAIGPDKQLDLWEQYLKAAEGPETRLYKLYARDYWLP